MRLRNAMLWSVAFVFILLLAHASAQGTQNGDRICLNYEPETVMLRGTLERRTFTNVSGLQETQYILKLDRPVCVNADPNNEYNQQQEKISELQLVPATFLKEHGASALLNRRVVVSGVLFGAHTQHHFTKVLLSVKEIKAAGKPFAKKSALPRSGGRKMSNAHHTGADLPQPMP